MVKLFKSLLVLLGLSVFLIMPFLWFPLTEPNVSVHTISNISHEKEAKSILNSTMTPIPIPQISSPIKKIEKPTRTIKKINKRPVLRKLMSNKKHFKFRTNLFDMALSSWKKKSANKNKVHLLLVCYYRGGSSFLSDVLLHYPSTFYTFEPFHYMGDPKTYNSNTTMESEVHNVLENLFKCNYKDLQFLLNWMKEESHNWLMQWNRYYWTICGLSGRNKCYNPETATKACNIAVLKLIKTIRVPLGQVIHLLENPPMNITYKVVHLVRDPRAMFVSRMKASPGYEKNASNIVEMCDGMMMDYQSSREIMGNFSDNFMQIRYEDLSRQPSLVVEKILKFAGLQEKVKILKYLNYITMSRKGISKHLYSTKRDSSTVWYRWRNELSVEEILGIQQVCGPVMHKFGYKLATNNEDLAKFYPINNFTMT